MRDGTLFSGGELREFLEGRRREALGEVDLAPVDEVRANPKGVSDRLVEQYRVEPVALDWDLITRTEPRETSFTVSQFGERYTVPGQTLSIIVPMTGETELLRRQPSTRSMGGGPRGHARGDALVFSVEGPNLTPEEVRSAVARMREDLDRHVAWANKDVAAWLPHLTSSVQTAVTQRKARLDAAASLSASLDIPIVATNSSRQVQVPVSRRTVRIEPSDRKPQGEEPRLAEAVYEDVLRTLSGLARAFERLPRTAAQFQEPELRDLVLFILNSNYEGAARGEVFNGSGKTDILLAWRDRNAFIGECKFWHGQAQFNKALDQLLGYVVWRDTKAALLLFIRGGNPSNIIEKADASVRGHGSFKNAVPAKQPDVRRDYVVSARSDPTRLIRLALLPVVIPTE